MLVHVLEVTLRLLHPFMPFVTEEVWTNLIARLPQEKEVSTSIMVSPYPEIDPSSLDDEAEKAMSSIREAIRLIRTARAEFNIAPNRSLEIFIVPGTLASALETETTLVRALAKVDPIRYLASRSQLPTSTAVTTVVGGAVMAIPMEGLIDLDMERKRLLSESKEADQSIQRLENRLTDSEFLEKAPEDVIEREQERLRTFEERRTHLQELLAQLSG